MAQNEKEQNDYRITYYNAVSSKEVDWLWYPYIPYGKITILQGDPGEGKSTMMMQLAALITTGKAMPDGSGDKIPGNVIYQAAEDYPEYNLVEFNLNQARIVQFGEIE